MTRRCLVLLGAEHQYAPTAAMALDRNDDESFRLLQWKHCAGGNAAPATSSRRTTSTWMAPAAAKKLFKIYALR